VHDLPGTTRDSVDTIVETEDGPLRFVDTAGMRRRSRIDEPTEYFSLVRAAIQEGQQRGQFRHDLPDKIAANCFFGALDEMVTSWVLSEHEFPLVNAADAVVDILLNGMRSCAVPGSLGATTSENSDTRGPHER